MALRKSSTEIRQTPAALVVSEPATTPLQRLEAYLFTSTSMTLNYDPTDLSVHRVALYFADYENDHRTETVALYNATTDAILSRQVVTNFSHGKYLIFDVQGPVSDHHQQQQLPQRGAERRVHQLKMIRILAEGNWSQSQLSLKWIPSTRTILPEVETAIDRAWTNALARPGVHLFDGPMCRMESWRATADRLELTLSLSSYKVFSRHQHDPPGICRQIRL